MSEEREEYEVQPGVIEQAEKIAAQHDRELDEKELEIISHQIQQVIDRAARTCEIVPRTPIHAVLIQKFGQHWQNAHITSYEFPGEIGLHVAQLKMIVQGEMVVWCEVVYQMGESCIVLEKASER